MSTLLQKNTRYLLTWLPVVLLTCCIIFYMLMRMQAHHMQEKQLQLKQFNIWSAFMTKKGNIERSIPGEYDIKQVTSEISKNHAEPRDTSIYLQQNSKILPFQVLSTQYKWKRSTYELAVYVSSTEISHL